MYNYAIRFEKDTAPGLAVFCRDLPELNSYGDDREHAVSEAVDAIETTLSIYVDQRRVIPEATPAQEGEEMIYLPAVTTAKIYLWNEMMARGMRKADLCRLLNVSQTQGDRLVDFLHTSKMEQIESALAALDVGIAVLPAHIDYEVRYTQNGKIEHFRFKHNTLHTQTFAWAAISSKLALTMPNGTASPTPEDVCRSHGISDALIYPV